MWLLVSFCSERHTMSLVWVIVSIDGIYLNPKGIVMGHEARLTTYGICELSKIVPALNQRRYYGIAIQPGLFDITLHRQWGRVGCRPRVMDEYFDSLDLALVKANSLYWTKIRRGYRESE